VYIATLIAADTRKAQCFAHYHAELEAAGCEPSEIFSLGKKAVEIRFVQNQQQAEKIKIKYINKIDIIVQRSSSRKKQLLVADMDSTMITVECIDELADYAGIKSEIAEITERAMAGELDFEDALRARVKLLAGLDENILAQCYAERVRIMPGAKALVQTMVAHGAQAFLVSGGFTYFADRVAEEIGFTGAVANQLDIQNGKLTGEISGPIVDAKAKADTLIAAADKAGLALLDTLAIGDGANDRMMISAAGLGIAYHAKPALEAVADGAIRHGDLRALLHAQGYRKAQWACDA
jgi:phosphoserine phosphatase